MTQAQHKCPKCEGSQRKGFIAERGEHSYFVPFWVEGEPQKVEVFGITAENVQMKGRNKFPVRSMRCDQCGYLELYAV